jgi:hypothetical protein
VSQPYLPSGRRARREPLLTSRLARQFHSSAVIELTPRKPVAAITEQVITAGITDLFAGKTLKPKEAAAILRCSIKTVHRIFRRMPGVIPTTEGSYLIPLSLFESWTRHRMAKVA